MYEFDSRPWETDQRGFEPRLSWEGWLIERIGTDGESRFGGCPPRYLQIGTGQWCGARYATLFPLQSAAMIYAKEFGYRVGFDVRVVWYRKGT